MAISRTQNVSATATSVAIATPSTNDLIVVYAYHAGSTTIPTTATGYTSIASQAGTAQAYNSGYKYSAGNETTSGTWTNATQVVCLVYRGARKIGTGFLQSVGNSATLSYGAPTLQVTDGTSWVAGFGGASSASAGMNGNTSGGTVLTNATNVTLANGLDTNAGTASFSTTTLAVTGSGRWITLTVEIRQLPVLVGGSGSYSDTGDAAGLLRRLQAVGGTGSFALTGDAASLLRRLQAVGSSGSFTLTGDTAGMLRTLRLTGATGSYSVTGDSASLLRTLRLVAGSGAYGLTGDSAALFRSLDLIGGTGAFSLTGGSAGMLKFSKLVGGTGSFALTGYDASLFKTGAPDHGPQGGTGGYLGVRRKKRELKLPQTYKTIMAISPANRFEVRKSIVKKLQEGQPINDDEAIALILSSL